MNNQFVNQLKNQLLLKNVYQNLVKYLKVIKIIKNKFISLLFFLKLLLENLKILV